MNWITQPTTKKPMPVASQVLVLPAAIKARVSVEAGSALTWRSIVGDAGRSVAIDHFGASADYKTLFEKFGITADAVVDAARETIAAAAKLDLAAAK